jgi:predicted DNA-binding transcriptional regulator AlpA
MRLINAKEASVMLGVRLPRLYELVRVNKVPCVKLGEKQLRFDPCRLAEWAAKGGSSDTKLSNDRVVSNAQAT